jgi:hypothetical protein
MVRGMRELDLPILGELLNYIVEWYHGICIVVLQELGILGHDNPRRTCHNSLHAAVMN